MCETEALPLADIGYGADLYEVRSRGGSMRLRNLLIQNDYIAYAAASGNLVSDQKLRLPAATFVTISFSLWVFFGMAILL